MPVPNSLQCYSFVPPPALSLLHSFTENILNHVSFYTAYALRNKSELIMRGPSLRKYTRQLWSRMACNSSPDPIPNLLIRCFFLPLSLLCSNLPAELTQMGTCCPIKDTFKAKHVIRFILQERGYVRLKTLSTTGWAAEILCIPLSLCRWQPLRSLITAAQLSLCRTELRDKWEWPS